LAFAPDGKSLVSASADTTLLVWDCRTDPRPRPADLTPRELQALWDQLRDDDPAPSWRAVGTLVQASAQSVPFLRERVQPIAAPAPEHLQRLLVDLGSPEFAVREKAEKALADLGDLAEPALRGILEGNPDLDLRQRARALRDRLPSWTGERLRLWRVIQVLEAIGTPDARVVLEKLAKGAPESRLTREAQASLHRLAKRSAE
jgi:hypothetical protein